MDEAKALIPYSRYVLIWTALVVLTGATITAAGLAFGSWGILAAILIAGVKGSLVLFYFMHLRYESLLLKLFVLVAFMTLVVIMVVTFTDILYR